MSVAQRRSNIVRQLRTVADLIEAGQFDASLIFRDEMVGVRQPAVSGDFVREMIATQVHGLGLIICGSEVAMPSDMAARLEGAAEQLIPKSVNMNDIVLETREPYTRQEVEQASIAYHK